MPVDYRQWLLGQDLDPDLRAGLQESLGLSPASCLSFATTCCELCVVVTARLIDRVVHGLYVVLNLFRVACRHTMARLYFATP